MAPAPMIARVRNVDAIVIGGSAGAVNGLSTLLSTLPAAIDVPVIIVVHLPAHQPSLLVEVFRARVAPIVREPVDKEPITPGIWFAPRGYHLLVDDGHFALSVDDPIKLSRPSIDALFESAADEYGARLAGFVITGASDDGADGVRAIHAAGGLIAVEDPATADTAIMPSAAIAAAPPDLVGDLKTLAETLRILSLRRSHEST